MSLSHDDIRIALEAGPTPDPNDPDKCSCPVCGKVMGKAGYGPHSASHRREIGDLPAKKKSTPKKTKTSPRPKAEPKPVVKPTVAESCLGIIYGYVGPQVPTSMVSTVAEWIADTEALIAALTKETTS